MRGIFISQYHFRYYISKSNEVKLTVYTILGQKVATLVNEYQPNGSYEVTFDAGKLASGTYFYKLNVGSFSTSNKMEHVN